MKGRGRRGEHPLGASEAGLAEGPVRESLQNPQIVPGGDCLARFPIPQGRGEVGEGIEGLGGYRIPEIGRTPGSPPGRPLPKEKENPPGRLRFPLFLRSY